MCCGKKVKLRLVGLDGNAFAILAAFRKQAHKEGWTNKEINYVLDQAKSADYDHLLYVIYNHCEEQNND